MTLPKSKKDHPTILQYKIAAIQNQQARLKQQQEALITEEALLKATANNQNKNTEGTVTESAVANKPAKG